MLGHGIPFGEALHGTTGTATYLIADEQESLERAADALRTRDAVDLADATRPWLITPRSFVPANQAERLAAVARLKNAVARAKERGSQELAERLDPITPLLDVTEPIVSTSLPRWMRESFQERDGSFGKIGVVYTEHRGADARAMEELATRIDQWREKHPDVRFASSLALLGEIVPTLRRDAPQVAGLAFFGLLLATLVVSRSPRRTFLVSASLALGVGVALAGMVLLDLKVNFYNMMVFPLAFGIGVDGAIYVVWDMLGGNEPDTYGTDVSRAVLVSTLTTTAAFGSMIIASNPGLQSLGKAALVAFGASLVADILWLPAFIRVMQQESGSEKCWYAFTMLSSNS